jgi:toxin YoeB
MSNWNIFYSKQAVKDANKLKASNLKPKAKKLLDLLAVDPFIDPPPFKSLKGDLSGFYSRRINIKHRLVYQVFKQEMQIKILRMWSHYE